MTPPLFVFLIGCIFIVVPIATSLYQNYRQKRTKNQSYFKPSERNEKAELNYDDYWMRRTIDLDKELKKTKKILRNTQMRNNELERKIKNKPYKARAIFFKPIEHCQFSTRIKNLRSENLFVLLDIMRLEEHEFKRLPNIGDKSLNEIKDFFVANNLHFGFDEEACEWPSTEVIDVWKKQWPNVISLMFVSSSYAWELLDDDDKNAICRTIDPNSEWFAPEFLAIVNECKPALIQSINETKQFIETEKDDKL